MNEENVKKVKPRQKTDRVTLTGESLSKIDRIILKAKEKKKGLKINRKDFVNWLIEVQPENLTVKDEKALFDRFYDEERFIREALKEVRRARSEGRELTLQMILNNRSEEKKAKKVVKSKSVDSKIVLQDDTVPPQKE